MWCESSDLFFALVYTIQPSSSYVHAYLQASFFIICCPSRSLLSSSLPYASMPNAKLSIFWNPDKFKRRRRMPRGRNPILSFVIRWNNTGTRFAWYVIKVKSYYACTTTTLIPRLTILIYVWTRISIVKIKYCETTRQFLLSLSVNHSQSRKHLLCVWLAGHIFPVCYAELIYSADISPYRVDLVLVCCCLMLLSTRRREREGWRWWGVRGQHLRWRREFSG